MITLNSNQKKKKFKINIKQLKILNNNLKTKTIT